MSEEKRYYVYVHRYASGPKRGEVFYVGKGQRKRYVDKRRNRYWHRLVDKYGFNAEIVCRFDNEKCALSLEVALIKHYGRENLCNLTDGGEGFSGYVATAETRRKISISKTGIGHTEDAKRRISIGLTGIKRSPETRSKMSAGSSGENSWIFGKHHSDETKAKMSAAHKRQKVLCSNGMIFNSVNDATRWLKSEGFEKATSGNISHCSKGKCKVAYGYKWSYIEDDT